MCVHLRPQHRIGRVFPESDWVPPPRVHSSGLSCNKPNPLSQELDRDLHSDLKRGNFPTRCPGGTGSVRTCCGSHGTFLYFSVNWVMKAIWKVSLESLPHHRLPSPASALASKVSGLVLSGSCGHKPNLIPKEIKLKILDSYNSLDLMLWKS